MAESNGSPDRKLRIATRVYASAEGNMKISDAMQVAGYCTPDRKGGTIYQRVRRTAQSLLAKGNATLAMVPPSIEVTGNYLINSSVSSQSTTNRTLLSDSSNTFATPPRIQNSDENKKQNDCGQRTNSIVTL